MTFSSSPPTIMHIDLNSCFATVEQQANPLLRGKPVAVAAYTTGNGCILTASYEAKRLGVKTGMRVGDGKALCPRLIILPPDPEKYRFINHKLQVLLGSYTPNLSVESIDEMVMDLMGTPALEQYLVSLRGVNDEAIFKNLMGLPRRQNGLAMTKQAMVSIGQQIKQRIKTEIGEWLTVSIGIAPNRYLAKIASGLHKPDGLDFITKENIEEVLGKLELTDLCGIKEGNSRRLHLMGITSPVAFYNASPQLLVEAFHSKVGYQWWQRLHGYEDGVMYKNFGDAESLQKTFGQSFALPKFRLPSDPEVGKIMTQLIVKMGRRLRGDGFTAKGFNVSCFFTDHSYWNKNKMVGVPIFADSDFITIGRTLLKLAPIKPIRIVAVTSFDLYQAGMGQQTLWDTDSSKRNITSALDAIADRWGEFTVTPGSMLGMEQKVLDRIAFGGGRGLRSMSS